MQILLLISGLAKKTYYIASLPSFTTTNTYRYNQTYLFQSAPKKYLLPKMAIIKSVGAGAPSSNILTTGSLTFTVPSGLADATGIFGNGTGTGNNVTITANTGGTPSSPNTMFARISSYNNSSGELVVSVAGTVFNANLTATFNDWLLVFNNKANNQTYKFGNNADLDGEFGTGPTGYKVGYGWFWTNQTGGGDWIDANNTKQGNVAPAWVITNLASGSTAKYTYTMNCTSVVQKAQTENRWLAVVMRTLSTYANGVVAGSDYPRTITGKFADDYTNINANAPYISVNYTDNTSTNLLCKTVASGQLGSAVSLTTSNTYGTPCFLEFERPTKSVSNANLIFQVCQHWSGTANPNTQIYLVDPPINTATANVGLAWSYPLDNGLSSNPNVIGVHRYMDGTTYTDFASTVSGPYAPNSFWNIGAEGVFDPAIFGTGSTDLTKLPHVGLGKWINASFAGVPGSTQNNWTIVNSSYSNDGFQPLASGVGAIRIEMPKANDAFFTTEPLQDGGFQSIYGSTGADAHIFMPEPLFGVLDRIFVRQYIRIGVVGGGNPTGSLSELLHTQQYAGDPNAQWTNRAGKFGVMPAHMPTISNSGQSGGSHAWQMRMSWKDTASSAGLGAAEEGGWQFGWHLYDFQSYNPVGYRYGSANPINEQFSQIGGMGTLYANKWYCVECEVKLNSVSNTAPGYTADGELRTWIDGRLAFEQTGMVFRNLPLEIPNPAPGGYNPSSSIRSCRQIGINQLWFNWFHGGLTKNSVNRVVFITGLAWANTYIGPMRTS